MVLALTLAVVAIVPNMQTELHPAFVFDRALMVRDYAAGKEAAKKKTKPDEVMRMQTIDIGKARSAKGWSFTAPYATLYTPTFWSRLRGFRDQTNYDDDKAFQASLEEGLSMPVADRAIQFYVFLAAWPGVNDYNKSINRHANERDVRDVKFVLLIDNDKILKPIVVNATGESNLSGTVAIPEQHTITGASTSSGTATATGTGGSATGTYRSRTSSSVTYTTTRVESFNAYFAGYTLRFPMFDPDGKPYVTPQTKELTIKVVRPDGEHSGTFKLAKYTPKK